MVSIIILSYNRSDLLHECLESIYKFIDKSTEVIVVDNKSSDDSVQMVKDHFKQVNLIVNTVNAGFAGGCNLGAKHAKGDYLLFVNSDADFLDNPIPQMVKTFSEHEDAGVVGGMLENHDGTLQRSFGAFYTVKNVLYLLFAGESGELKRFKSSTTQPTDWVSGGFMMCQKDKYEKVKGFNESYFMYIEDMDLCYRMKKAGFGVFVNPDVRVKHLGQGSSNKTFAIVQIYKGLQIFYKQQRSPVEYYIVKVLLLVKALAALSIGLVTFNKYLIRTYLGALKTL